MHVPRDYQIQAVQNVFADLARVRSTLLVMATGAGKTCVFLDVAERFLRENPGKKVMIVAHRAELIFQPANRWRQSYGEWPSIEMAEMRIDGNFDADLFSDGSPTSSNLIIASIQSLNSGRRCWRCTVDCQKCKGTGRIRIGEPGEVFKCKECEGDGWVSVEETCDKCFEHFGRRLTKFPPDDFGLLIYDECHHIISPSSMRIIRYFYQNKTLKLLGVTATPDRTDEEAMGQVFESVALEYSLPQPIFDGWLTPIKQQMIEVANLNLTRVRTTAGDLNAGDLEREMMAEKVMHQVVTPLVEISNHLKMGTIDQLIKQNRLAELPGLCTKREPTLVHCVDVAHAERTTEILNRYLPDSALCIIGTTPKPFRRDGLKKFAEGKYQYLLSCGVFLEGTDLPNVSVVAVARPTKSRSLFAQMVGRGLRPLPGLVDGISNAAERCQRILDSDKPACTILDYVGNAGRHKLVCTIDLLGNEEPDELIEKIIRKAKKSAQAIDVLQALRQAKEEAEAEKRRQQRADAEKRRMQLEEVQKRAADQRKGIVAGTTYSTRAIDPFDIFDLTAKREPGWHKGRKPTEAMLEVLRRAKVPFTNETTFWEAHCLIDEVVRRRNAGLCTYKQAQWLRAHGYSGEMKFDECQKVMNNWAANGWRKPQETAV